MVFLNGELWSAEAEESVAVGDEVVVTGHHGNLLRVKKKL
jgi:membrane protein implicated in regulation of membrane protease activity